MDVAEAVQSFADYLKKQNLKLTRQRKVITEVFFCPDERTEHPTVEELYLKVKERDARVGYATIYRTLKLLVDAHLAVPQRLTDQLTRYEPDIPGEHHDHMHCQQCGLIVEFESNEIELLQEQIAEKLGFSLSDHSMHLFGSPKQPCLRSDCLDK